MERSEFSNSSTISSAGSVQDLSQKIAQSDESSSNHQETVNQYLTQNVLIFNFIAIAEDIFISTGLKWYMYVSGSSESLQCW